LDHDDQVIPTSNFRKLNLSSKQRKAAKREPNPRAAAAISRRGGKPRKLRTKQPAAKTSRTFDSVPLRRDLPEDFEQKLELKRGGAGCIAERNR
jgi:hypothetical protein